MAAAPLTRQYLSLCCLPGLGLSSGSGPVLPNLAVAVGSGRGVEGAVLGVPGALPQSGHLVVTQPLHVTLKQLGHTGIVVTKRHSVGVPAMVILSKGMLRPNIQHEYLTFDNDPKDLKYARHLVTA